VLSAESAGHLRDRLRRLGLSRRAIDAAWPRWWSSAAGQSASAQLELRFALARNLGLDPHSLIDEGADPRFLWAHTGRFKHLSAETQTEKEAIASFGRAVGIALSPGVTTPFTELLGRSAAELRRAMLASSDSPFVRLLDLLSLCWSTGTPVIHLRVYPWPQKRMAAMSLRVSGRSIILLARDSQVPAPIAFYVAHEIGHIALGHLPQDDVLVDLAGTLGPQEDPEESEADRYALELLTGNPDFRVESSTPLASASELIRTAQASAAQLGVEPGTLALCFGYSTGKWAIANAAMQTIYTDPKPAWEEVNAVARTSLAFAELPDGAADFLDSVLGAVGDEQSR